MDDIHEQYAQAAESLIGIPFKWWGRNSHGVDCIGLLYLAGTRIGYFEERLKDYSYRPRPDERIVESGLRECLVKLPNNRLQQRGTIIGFAIQGEFRYLGIYTGVKDDWPRFVHADCRRKAVVETALDLSRWKIHSLWQLPL